MRRRWRGSHRGLRPRRCGVTRSALLPRIEDRAGRRVGARHARRVGLDHHDPIGVGVGQRSPEHGVDHAEDRDVDADAQRDRQDDDERVPRRTPEDAAAVAGVSDGGGEGAHDERRDLRNAHTDVRDRLQVGGSRRFSELPVDRSGFAAAAEHAEYVRSRRSIVEASTAMRRAPTIGRFSLRDVELGWVTGHHNPVRLRLALRPARCRAVDLL